MRQVSHSQNFFNKPKLLDPLVRDAHITSSDLVVEIGAGHGEITRVLSNHCRAVIAIEKDQKLYNQLRREFATNSQVTIHHADVLDFQFPTEPYKVFSNIPFNYTADIVRLLTTQQNLADDIFLFAQQSAAEQYRGLPRESLKSLLLKPAFLPSITHRFKRTDFRPVPKIDIVLLRLKRRATPIVEAKNIGEWRDFVVYALSQTQPSLVMGFKSIVTPAQLAQLTKQVGISKADKPTDITFDQWLELYNFFSQSADLDKKQLVNGSYINLLKQQRNLSKIHRTRQDKSWREK